MLQVPVQDALVTSKDGREERLQREQFYVPGSVLEARIDTSHPVAAGLNARTDVMFDESPVFKVAPGTPGVRAFAWYGKDPLRSGWAWGQKYLDGGVIAVEARMGKGRAVLYSAEILQRAQPHGTFKLLFNSIYYRKN